MEGTGITPVMDMNRGYGDFGFGGGSGLWLFAILALMWGGNGFFGNNANLGYRPATAEDVNNGFNFADLQDQNRDIMGAITGAAAQSVGQDDGRAVSGALDDALIAAQGLPLLALADNADVPNCVAAPMSAVIHLPHPHPAGSRPSSRARRPWSPPPSRRGDWRFRAPCAAGCQ